jgi:hypothetical protein
MADIEITLTKKNLRLLIKHVFIGNWILTGTKTKQDKELDLFFDTILSIGKNYNILEGIEYSELSGCYDIGKEREDEYLKSIEEYEEDIFWEELVNRLAIRDFRNEYSEDEMLDMEGIERMKLIWKEEEKYNEEFEKNGLDRLQIKK